MNRLVAECDTRSPGNGERILARWFALQRLLSRHTHSDAYIRLCIEVAMGTKYPTDVSIAEFTRTIRGVGDVSRGRMHRQVLLVAAHGDPLRTCAEYEAMYPDAEEPGVCGASAYRVTRRRSSSAPREFAPLPVFGYCERLDRVSDALLTRILDREAGVSHSSRNYFC
jgi:hypothetical protein